MTIIQEKLTLSTLFLKKQEKKGFFNFTAVSIKEDEKEKKRD